MEFMSDGFSSFAALNFNLDGPNGSRLRLADRIAYSSTPLSQPLLYLSPSYSTVALHAHQLLHTFMEEEESDELIYELVCNAIQSTAIADELFAQLLKQTRSCRSRGTLRRGILATLATLVGTPPSEELAACLLSHLRRIMASSPPTYQASQSTVAYLASQAIHALLHIQRLGPRKAVSRKEIKFVLQGLGSDRLTLSLPLTVGPEVIMVEVDPWMTVDDFRADACAQLGISSGEDSLLAIRLTRKGASGSSLTILPSSAGLLALLHEVELRGEVAPVSLDGSDCRWRHPPAHCALDQVLALDSVRGYLSSPSAASNDAEGYASPVRSPVHVVRPDNGRPQPTEKASMAKKLLDRCKALGTLLSPRDRDRRRERERQQRASSPSVAADRAQPTELELDVIVAVFPHGSPPPPCHSAGPSSSNSTNPSPRHGIPVSLIGVQTERDRCGLGPVWPKTPVIRDLLLHQLAGAIARGDLECTGDDEALRMMALFCAFKHLRELSVTSYDVAAIRRSFYQQLSQDLGPELCPGMDLSGGSNSDLDHDHAQGMPSEASRIAFVSARLEHLLPKKLLDPAEAKWSCIDALDQVLDLGGVDLRVDSAPPARLPQADWHAFLASAVARLWQQLEGLSAEECRDEYLESARCALGYGELSFRPSTVEIRTVSVSVSVSDEEGQASDGAVSGTGSTRSNRVDRSSRDSSRTTGTDLSCVECTEEEGKAEPAYTDTDVTTSTADDIELTVSARGVSVAVREASAEVSGGGGEGRVRRVLLHLAFDEITAWGHSKSSLCLKYSHSMDEEVAGSEGTDSVSVGTMDAPVIAELIGTYINISDSQKVE